MGQKSNVSVSLEFHSLNTIKIWTELHSLPTIFMLGEIMQGSKMQHIIANVVCLG